MKLSALAKKPQLTKAEITDEAIVKKYGETVEFYIYDRYDMDVYMKLLNTEESDIKTLTNLVKDMVMDENGKAIVTDGEIFPPDILIKIVEEVVKHLGNSMIPTLES